MKQKIRQALQSFSAPQWAFSLFFLFALYRISFPGLNYDELYFANAALGGKGPTFVQMRWGELPLFLMTYLGALKAWLYWPLFKLFGVSVWSVRLPVVILGAFGLFLLQKTLRQRGEERAAWMFLLLLVLNPAFVWGVKLDFGPVVLEFFLQALAFFSFLQGAHPLLLGLILAAGLFNKIIFVWWLCGFLLAGFLLFPKERLRLSVSALLPAAFSVFWLWQFSFSLPTTKFLLAERWELLTRYLPWLLEGSAIYRNIFGGYENRPPFLLLWLLLLVGVTFFFLGQTKKRKLFFFVLVQTMGTAACIFLTPPANSYWHFFHLLPWCIFLLALGLSRWGKLGLGLFCCLCFQLIFMHALYWGQMDSRPWKAMWSTAIYPLMEFCQSAPYPCVSVDWGAHTQILAATGSSEKAWEHYQKPQFSPDIFYIAYASNQVTGIRYFPQFRNEAEKAGWELGLEKSIEEKGKVVFDIYRLRRR